MKLNDKNIEKALSNVKYELTCVMNSSTCSYTRLRVGKAIGIIDIIFIKP